MEVNNVEIDQTETRIAEHFRQVVNIVLKSLAPPIKSLTPHHKEYQDYLTRLKDLQNLSLNECKSFQELQTNLNLMRRTAHQKKSGLTFNEFRITEWAKTIKEFSEIIGDYIDNGTVINDREILNRIENITYLQESKNCYTKRQAQQIFQSIYTSSIFNLVCAIFNDSLADNESSSTNSTDSSSEEEESFSDSNNSTDNTLRTLGELLEDFERRKIQSQTQFTQITIVDSLPNDTTSISEEEKRSIVYVKKSEITDYAVDGRTRMLKGMDIAFFKKDELITLSVPLKPKHERSNENGNKALHQYLTTLYGDGKHTQNEKNMLLKWVYLRRLYNIEFSDKSKEPKKMADNTITFYQKKGQIYYKCKINNKPMSERTVKQGSALYDPAKNSLISHYLLQELKLEPTKIKKPISIEFPISRKEPTKITNNTIIFYQKNDQLYYKCKINNETISAKKVERNSALHYCAKNSSESHYLLQESDLNEIKQSMFKEIWQKMLYLPYHSYIEKGSEYTVDKNGKYVVEDICAHTNDGQQDITAFYSRLIAEIKKIHPELEKTYQDGRINNITVVMEARRIISNVMLDTMIRAPLKKLLEIQKKISDTTDGATFDAEKYLKKAKLIVEKTEKRLKRGSGIEPKYRKILEKWLEAARYLELATLPTVKSSRRSLIRKATQLIKLEPRLSGENNKTQSGQKSSSMNLPLFEELNTNQPDNRDGGEKSESPSEESQNIQQTAKNNQSKETNRYNQIPPPSYKRKDSSNSKERKPQPNSQKLIEKGNHYFGLPDTFFSQNDVGNVKFFGDTPNEPATTRNPRHPLIRTATRRRDIGYKSS